MAPTLGVPTLLENPLWRKSHEHSGLISIATSKLNSMSNSLFSSPRHLRLAREITQTIDVVPSPRVTTSSHHLNILPQTNLTGPDYSRGLAGVNLELDQKLIKWLLISMLCVLVSILLLRIYQLFHSHVRHIHCLHAERREQSYWTFEKNYWWPWMKKEIIYAPLGKKRHNREWQLSKAVNYGTLPGRVHSVLLMMYVISNLTYCSILPYGRESSAELIAELRGRSGILAVVNMVPLVLMAGRNNPFIGLLKISFDTYNLFHRWIGRIVLLESLIHVFAWYANYSARHGVTGAGESFYGNIFLVSGLGGIIAMSIMMLQSLSAIRHAFYETFLHVHQILAFFTFLGVYVHLDVERLPALPYIRIAVFLWVVERSLRLIRLIYLNVRFGQRQMTTTTVEALPGEACRVTFQLPRHVTIRPGSHVYAYLPSISLWMSHPFSVAWTNVESEPPTGPAFGSPTECSPIDVKSSSNPFAKEINLYKPSKPSSLASDIESQTSLPSFTFPTHSNAPTSISLVTAARSGMTRKLYDKAISAPNRTIQMRGLIEGPYAGHDSLSSYGTVVMFAGGAGITHHLVQIRHLLASANARTVATRKIVLVWSVRDLEALSWVQPWMDEILRMPGRRDVLSMNLFVTKPRGKKDYVSPSRSIKLVGGKRCQPGVILDEVLPERVGAVMVSVCGPGAFADEVRSAVRERLRLGVIEMNEESFTW